ncbi:MAG: patatin-like phospholipase family protein [Deltaproteobacteria bacterium]|nr:patatin-like phospholipase family protein [Deltaproteobacteria bacterium]
MEKVQHGDKARTGVAFSSGFFGFFAHAGFLAAVREVGIRPLAYSGASSGAIVAAMAACSMEDRAIRDMLFRLKKSDFWDPDPWSRVLLYAFRRFRGYTGYLRGGGFARMLKRLPAKKFEECGTPLAISATNLTRRTPTVFSSGDLIKVVQASGSVPVLFKPVEINGDLCVDGGVCGKAPVAALAGLCDLDRIIVHFIPSSNLEEGRNAFLEKRFSAWHIQHLSVNMARQEAYEKELQMVRERGIEVVEIRTESPALGPKTLHRGKEAYEAARASGLGLLGAAALFDRGYTAGS